MSESVDTIATTPPKFERMERLRRSLRRLLPWNAILGAAGGASDTGGTGETGDKWIISQTDNEGTVEDPDEVIDSREEKIEKDDDYQYDDDGMGQASPRMITRLDLRLARKVLCNPDTHVSHDMVATPHMTAAIDAALRGDTDASHHMGHPRWWWGDICDVREADIVEAELEYLEMLKAERRGNDPKNLEPLTEGQLSEMRKRYKARQEEEIHKTKSAIDINTINTDREATSLFFTKNKDARRFIETMRKERGWTTTYPNQKDFDKTERGFKVSNMYNNIDASSSGTLNLYNADGDRTSRRNFPRNKDARRYIDAMMRERGWTHTQLDYTEFKKGKRCGLDETNNNHNDFDAPSSLVMSSKSPVAIWRKELEIKIIVAKNFMRLCAEGRSLISKLGPKKFADREQERATIDSNCAEYEDFLAMLGRVKFESLNNQQAPTPPTLDDIPDDGLNNIDNNNNAESVAKGCIMHNLGRPKPKVSVRHLFPQWFDSNKSNGNNGRHSEISGSTTFKKNVNKFPSPPTLLNLRYSPENVRGGSLDSFRFPVSKPSIVVLCWVVIFMFWLESFKWIKRRGLSRMASAGDVRLVGLSSDGSNCERPPCSR